MSTLLETPVLPGLTLVEEETVTTLAETRMLQAITEGVMGPQGIQGATGPQGIVSLADTNIWTAPQIGRFIVRESWLDPTDPLFGGIFDNASHPLSSVYGSLGAAQAVYPHAVALTDEIDWAATQAAINYMGSTAAHRAGRIYLPGWGVINRTLAQDHKAIEWEGKGARAVAGNVAQSSGSGLRAGTNFVAGTPMLKLNSAWGSKFRRFRFLQSTSGANQPSAFVEENYAGIQDSPPNTKIDYESVWFGRFNGLGSTETEAVYPELTSLWGIQLIGGDFQLDQSEAVRCTFFGIGQALRNSVAGNQQVLWWFRNCDFWNLQQVANISAEMRFTNCYAAFTRVRDFDITGGRLLLETYASELSKQWARIRNGASLVMRDASYFQITNNLLQDAGVGLVLDAQDNASGVIRISGSDFRPQSYTGGTWKLRVKGTNAGPTSHKTLILEDVTVNGAPLSETNLDCAITSNLQQVTVMGHLQGPVDASGWGQVQRFYNDLRVLGALPNFAKDVPTRDGKSIKKYDAVSGNLALTFNTDQATEHRVSVYLTGATFTLTGTPYDQQILEIVCVLINASQTWTWPTTGPTMRYQGGAGPNNVGKAAGTEIGVRFAWDSVGSVWREVARWEN